MASVLVMMELVGLDRRLKSHKKNLARKTFRDVQRARPPRLLVPSQGRSL